MKRFISTILVGFFILSTIIFFVGCNNTESPDSINITDQHREYALRAIEISDAYFDGKESVSETSKLMDELYAQGANLPEIDAYSPEDSYNAVIETAVTIMSTEFNMAINSSTEPGENVLHWRNNLAELIGKDTR